MKAALTIVGIAIGCIVGYFSAHYFPLWGGFVMLAEPHSPARNSLVPGHVLFYASVLGATGFIVGQYLTKSKNS